MNLFGQTLKFLHAVWDGEFIFYKGSINIFLRAVYLWDDKFTMTLNVGDRPIEIDGVLLDEIGANNAAFMGLSLVADAPPS